MSIEATVIAGTDKFRIVKQVEGERVTYFLEKLDGADALGVERWKSVDLGDGRVDTVSRQMRDYIIQQAIKADKGHNDA